MQQANYKQDILRFNLEFEIINKKARKLH